MRYYFCISGEHGLHLGLYYYYNQWRPRASPPLPSLSLALLSPTHTDRLCTNTHARALSRAAQTRAFTAHTRIDLTLTASSFSFLGRSSLSSGTNPGLTQCHDSIAVAAKVPPRVLVVFSSGLSLIETLPHRLHLPHKMRQNDV